MNIQISDRFNYSKLIKFTIPSILMMFVTSIYIIVDGFFVSNYVGKNAFSSLNIIFPFVLLFSTFSFMIGSGGCALVAKNLGEGKSQKANEIFSMLMFTLVLVGISLSILGIIFIKPISILLGATPELLENCMIYGIILFIALPGFMLQIAFQNFVIVADKPSMGLQISILAGITNIVLDFLFIIVFKWGIAGAACATGLSQILGGIVPLYYFLSKKNNSRIKFVKFNWDFRALLISCANGSSEMMTNLSNSILNILYNLQLIKYFGMNGVSAFGIILYVSLVFTGVYMGYAIGVSPVISYHFGAGNKDELHSLLKKSLILTISSSVVLTVIAEWTAPFLSEIFVGYDKELLALSITGLRLYSLSYLVSGINIFASAYFTALNNGVVSSLISFLRTLVFQVAMILLLPIILGENSIWYAILVAELLCLVVTIILFKVNQKKYGY